MTPVRSRWRLALRGRCPRCGEGGIYQGLLDIRTECPVCRLDLRGHDSGDGPAFFVLSFWCLVAVLGALLLEMTVSPPLWVQAVGWGVVVLAGSVAGLRVAKAYLLAWQYQLLGTQRNDAG